MAKELFVSSTPHETRVGLVEDDQLAEIYLERENEYTLAGSIYKGRVTRVLPGMQSAFVDIGLERDAFLYVSDFMELEDQDEVEEVPTSRPAPEPRHQPQPRAEAQPTGAEASAHSGEAESHAGEHTEVRQLSENRESSHPAEQRRRRHRESPPALNVRSALSTARRRVTSPSFCQESQFPSISAWRRLIPRRLSGRAILSFLLPKAGRRQPQSQRLSLRTSRCLRSLRVTPRRAWNHIQSMRNGMPILCLRSGSANWRGWNR